MINGQNPTMGVLLVEDSEEDIFFFKRSLAKSGVTPELFLATDGKSAVSILSNEELRARICLVFLDLKLPLMNGFDVLRWIRSEQIDPLPRIVILSGSSHTSDRVLAAELGVSDYLVKPITPEAIRERLTHFGCAAAK
jgi:DNA-binding response OmpR family regulator